MIPISSAQRRFFSVLLESAASLGFEVYLVGGLVRDLLLGHDLRDRDIDVLVVGNAAELGFTLKREIGGKVERFDRFLTAKLTKISGFEGIAETDFATARTERYEAPGELPVVQAADLASDLRRRDFTVNAIAVPISSLSEVDTISELNFVDPFDGRADLNNGLLRVLHDKSFTDDPTRMLRACRYLARIDGVFEPATAELFQAALEKDALGTVSLFRIRREIEKCFQEEDIRGVSKAAVDVGLWGNLVPLSYTASDRWLSLMDSVSALGSATGALRAAGLLALLWWTSREPEQVEQFYRESNMSKREIGRLAEIVTELTKSPSGSAEAAAEVLRRYRSE